MFWGYVLAPIPGRYFGRLLRIAYYRLTLKRVGADFDIEIGSRFGSSNVTIGNKVGISPGCTICACDIGDGARIGSGVRIIGGYRQHGRNRRGEMTDDLRYQHISIGRHVFIGVDALVMANVGAYATVGAGSVVYDPVQPGTTVVGNPAQWRWSSQHLVKLAEAGETGSATG